MIEEDFIICDIESNTLEEIPNADIDELRYVGFKYKDKRACFHYSQHKEIQSSINFSKYIVGHNFKKFDRVILERYGFGFKDNIIIDTFEIVDNRFRSMLYMDLNQGDRSLERLCEILKLDCKKGKYDYSKLKEDILTGNDLEELKEYLYGDLDACEEVFKYCYNLFYGFKELMSDRNKELMCWLVNKPGSTAYKCVCNLANLPEEYSDVVSEEDTYDGGYVSEPYGDFIE
jgi:hypothetical protein